MMTTEEHKQLLKDVDQRYLAQGADETWERDYRTYLRAARDKIDLALQPGRRRMPALTRDEFKALRYFMLKFDNG